MARLCPARFDRCVLERHNHRRTGSNRRNTTLFTIAYLFWNRSVEVVGPNVAGFSHYLIPVFGAIMSVVILDEVIETYHFVAITLILTGLYLATRNRTY